MSKAKRKGWPPAPPVLSNRRVLPWVLLFCVIESVWSWTSITRGVRHRDDLIDILFFVFVIFIAVSIAYRSPFWADRAVFRAIAGAFALIVVRAAPLTPAAMFVVDVAHAFMWTIAALVSLVVLGRVAHPTEGQNDCGCRTYPVAPIQG